MIFHFRPGSQTEWLSNFYEAPFKFDGLSFRNAEAAFQSCKDITRQGEFVSLNGPAAKQLGKKVKLHPNWEGIKQEVMYNVLYAKFTQNPKLAISLTETFPDTIVELNKFHDNEWGTCCCPKCKDIKGKNLMGKTLMRLRDEELLDHYCSPEMEYVIKNYHFVGGKDNG